LLVREEGAERKANKPIFINDKPISNMRQTIRFSFSFVILIAMSHLVIGQKFVNEFLNIGVGARSHGMFGSVVANGGDGTSAFWNVAGLTEIEGNLQLNAMRSPLFGGIANYDFISVAKKLNTDRKSFASLAVVRLGVDNIPNTLNLIGPDGTIDYDKVVPFSVSDVAALLSYAQQAGFDENFSFGGTIKIIRRSIGPFGDAWGIGADVGVRYKIGESIILGATARDVTTTVNAWTFTLDDETKQIFAATNNDIPVSSTEIALPRIILGGAYILRKNNFKVTTELDLNISTDGTRAAVLSGKNFNLDPSLGVEVGYLDKVFVRGGLGNMQSVINQVNAANTKFTIQPNIGLGLNLGRLRIDYALANLGSANGLQISHIFSLGLDFVPRT
jgi:hypothetical protein